METKMLREIANDNLTPKKHDFYHQNELHEKIRNDEDYDDWEYGTEPIYESKRWWINKLELLYFNHLNAFRKGKSRF